MDRLLVHRDADNRAAERPEQKTLDENPSYFAEIYIMRADGSDQKRLTTGLATTAARSSRPTATIVWRRFDEQGLIADSGR